jgi:hypothetical protein
MTSSVHPLIHVTHSAKSEVQPTAGSAPINSFAAKIRLVSNVTCKEEEFNVWHANADKAVASFVWGCIGKSVDKKDALQSPLAPELIRTEILA